MEYRAMIEKAQGWWIGWLVDLPGVNAQEPTQEDLLESLRVCAEDMLDLKGIHDPKVVIFTATEAWTADCHTPSREATTDGGPSNPSTLERD
ncbi:MAG: hypothetical protein FJY85_21665 [Deltaproteobacteria bacterium]|nr:hypothetical protein [Deltaproteobacteria bacterium]